MNVKLLTEHHLEILSLKGGCTGLSESTLVKMRHCWKSHVVAHGYPHSNARLYLFTVISFFRLKLERCKLHKKAT